MADWVRKESRDRWILAVVLLWLALLVIGLVARSRAFDRGERAGWVAGWNAAQSLAKQVTSEPENGGTFWDLIRPDDCGSDCCTNTPNGWGPCDWDTPDGTHATLCRFGDGWERGYAQAREDWKAQGWECVAPGRAAR